MAEHALAIGQAVSVFPNFIDHMGFRREDYEADLVAHLWNLFAGEFVHRELVDTVIKNKVRDYQRRRRAKIPSGVLAEPSFYDCERRVINRELIRLLRVALSGDDWFLLKSYVENDCRVRDTWVRCRSPVSYDVFRAKLHRLLAHCKEFIDGVCNYRSDGRVIN